jgi:hypothetical protein
LFGWTTGNLSHVLCCFILQFPLQRLRDLIDGKMLDAKTGKPRECYDKALKRAAFGVLYCTLHVVGHGAYPNEYMESQQFMVWLCLFSFLSQIISGSIIWHESV